MAHASSNDFAPTSVSDSNEQDEIARQRDEVVKLMLNAQPKPHNPAKESSSKRPTKPTKDAGTPGA
jgi:hypothetical protein